MSTILLVISDIKKNTVPLLILLYIIPHWLWKMKIHPCWLWDLIA